MTTILCFLSSINYTKLFLVSGYLNELTNIYNYCFYKILFAKISKKKISRMGKSGMFRQDRRRFRRLQKAQLEIRSTHLIKNYKYFLIL